MFTFAHHFCMQVKDAWKQEQSPIFVVDSREICKARKRKNYHEKKKRVQAKGKTKFDVVSVQCPSTWNKKLISWLWLSTPTGFLCTLFCLFLSQVDPFATYRCYIIHYYLIVKSGIMLFRFGFSPFMNVE